MLVHREGRPAVILCVFRITTYFNLYMDKDLYSCSRYIEQGIPFEQNSEIYLPIKRMNKRIYECLVGNKKRYVSMDINHSLPDESFP